MATFGAAKTGKFQIGAAELRVGPLNKAGKLTKEHSVGLIDQVTVNIEQTSVDLKGGFPQITVDTQVVDQSAQVTATLREFSRRNLGILLGQGLVYESNSDAADILTSTDAELNSSSNTINLVVATMGALAQGDWINVWDPTDAAKCAILQLTSTPNETTGLANINTNFKAPTTFASGAAVGRVQPVAVGNVSSVNYFTAQLVMLDRQSGRPKIYNLWKVSTGSGMNLANNAQDFASTELVLKVLQPTMTDYTTGSLSHLADIIHTYPMGMFAEMSDATATP